VIESAEQNWDTSRVTHFRQGIRGQDSQILLLRVVCGQCSQGRYRALISTDCRCDRRHPNGPEGLRRSVTNGRVLIVERADQRLDRTGIMKLPQCERSLTARVNRSEP